MSETLTTVRETCSCDATFEVSTVLHREGLVEAMRHARAWRRQHHHVLTTTRVDAIGLHRYLDEADGAEDRRGRHDVPRN